MPTLADFPGFICEACTVRAVTQRPLRAHSLDWTLLALERMRILDVINSWSLGTHQQYQSKMKVIRAFERQFDIPILRLTPLASPPVSAAIPLGREEGAGPSKRAAEQEGGARGSPAAEEGAALLRGG